MLFSLLHRSFVIGALLMLALFLPTDGSTHDLRFVRLAVLLLMAIEGLLILKSVFASEKAGDAWKGLSMSVFFVFFMLTVTEAAFMFVPRSHGVGHALGAQLWFKKYWQPLNTMGYRDEEPAECADSAVFFVGDSFTAGHGLKHVSERFSNVASTQLKASGHPSAAVNLGRNGLDTGQEFADMVRFMERTGIQPEAIVLQYFGNDIQGASSKHGLQFKGFAAYDGLPSGTERLLRGSYLLNYLYWLVPRADVSSYLDYLDHAYQQPDIMASHLDELKAFKLFADSIQIPLVVVVFPFMQDLEVSERVYMQQIREFLKQAGISFIDVSTLIADLSPSQRMVNANDGHASNIVNERVGEAIFEHLSSAFFSATHVPDIP